MEEHLTNIEGAVSEIFNDMHLYKDIIIQDLYERIRDSLWVIQTEVDSIKTENKL